MTHALKTWPAYFNPIETGKKNFELRKDDRPFEVGDDIILQEYDPEKKEYSGKELQFIIGYIYRGNEFGLKKGYCIIALKEKPDYAHDYN